MLGRILTISLVAATIVLIIVLQITTPSTIGPLGILIVFILMYVSALSVLTFFLFGLSKVISRLSASFTVAKPIHALSLRRAYYFSSILALAPVMIIGMQSVGEIGVYEVMLVALFIGISCVYIVKKST